MSLIRPVVWHVDGYAFPNLILILSFALALKIKPQTHSLVRKLPEKIKHLIEDDLPFAVIKMKSKNNSNVYHVTDTTTLSEEADTRAIAHVIEDDKAENRGAVPSLHEFLHHRATEASHKQGAENVGQASAEYTVNKYRLIVRLVGIVGAAGWLCFKHSGAASCIIHIFQ